MLETLQNEDKDFDLLFTTKKDIINSITIYDVKTFLESLGVDEIIINEEKQYLICPTICHNPLHETASMKLYWYQNNKIFRCYTECNEAMSIFQLYKKVMLINEDKQVDDEEAKEYVLKCLQHININSIQKRKNSFDLNKDKYEFDTHIPILKEYPESVLSCFSHYYHPSWLHDGITKEAMDKFKISFSISQNKIIIPHFDINGRLIGIRARLINEDEIEILNGKYMPIQIGNVIYSHPLQFNLYGIYEHQIGIRARRSAVIVEGEKSVLLDHGYYGKYSNAVACCGSNINKYHISLLTDFLGVNDITIAFDKEYNNPYDERAKNYRKKIESICKKYKYKASFSYIWDYNNLLQEKDSPLDKGKIIYEKLMKERVHVM